MASDRPTKTVLLLGRTGVVLDEVEEQLTVSGIRLLGGTTMDDVRDVLSSGQRIDHVLMGAGIDLQTRLDIIREIFDRSDETTVHLKDAASGPAGMVPFVAGVLEGLRDFPPSAEPPRPSA